MLSFKVCYLLVDSFGLIYDRLEMARIEEKKMTVSIYTTTSSIRYISHRKGMM